MKRAADFVTQFSLRQFLSRKKEVAKQSLEFVALESFLAHASSLKVLKSVNQPHLFNIASGVKSKLTKVCNSGAHDRAMVMKYFEQIETELATQSQSSATSSNLDWSVRLAFTRKYFASLKTAVVERDIDESKLTASDLCRVLDVALLGTSSERIEEHIRIYGPALSNARLQDCFYSLYVPEVEACAGLLVDAASRDKSLKHHLKGVPKLAKTYLLDKLELNTKARCVLAWSDPTYSGFKPLPDDHTVSSDTLVAARRQFFREGEDVGGFFVAEVISLRRQFYEDRLENREARYLAGAFILGTCLLDWGICSL